MAHSGPSTIETKPRRAWLDVLIAAGCGMVLYAVAFSVAAAPVASGKKEDGFSSAVPAAVLLDADSDSILYEKNGDQPVAPASLAKLMTLEFLFN